MTINSINPIANGNLSHNNTENQNDKKPKGFSFKTISEYEIRAKDIQSILKRENLYSIKDDEMQLKKLSLIFGNQKNQEQMKTDSLDSIYFKKYIPLTPIPNKESYENMDSTFVTPSIIPCSLTNEKIRRTIVVKQGDFFS